MMMIDAVDQEEEGNKEMMIDKEEAKGEESWIFS